MIHVQCAASLINSLSGVGGRPLQWPEIMACYAPSALAKGLVVVGSHVPLADRQLHHLLGDEGCVPVELDVDRILAEIGAEPGDIDCYYAELFERLCSCVDSVCVPVLFTSRGEVHCETPAMRQRLSRVVSGMMADLVGSIAGRLGWLISKGGIATQAVLERGLGQSILRLNGRIMPGISVVEAMRSNGVVMPVVTVPGNLGLTTAFRFLSEVFVISLLRYDCVCLP